MAFLFNSSSAYSVSQIPSLTNKVFLVTGGTAGIGFGIAANLLSHNPAKIYLLSSGSHQATLASNELSKYGDAARKVEWIQCDLSDLESVDKCARSLQTRLSRLDALICNAGVGIGIFKLSKDDIDTHFQINHLSQMHLILTLLPNLLRTADENGDARVVLQCSDLHRATPATVRFEHIDEINEDIGPSYLYNRSKLAQLLFLRGLNRRLQEGTLGNAKYHGNLYVNATHPGAVSTTQQDQAIEAYGTLAKVATAVARPFMKNPVTDGCLPALWAATSPDIVTNSVNGAYIIPPNKISEPSKQSQNDTLENNLWNVSLKLLKDRISTYTT
ncbi:hypothetical protein EDC01DRAFT_678883 [Geopyxis carbonaria]|nr:hypothetical protein EDC01DRAFT_678883 [Geopyxis carbonaria]